MYRAEPEIKEWGRNRKSVFIVVVVVGGMSNGSGRKSGSAFVVIDEKPEGGAAGPL